MIDTEDNKVINILLERCVIIFLPLFKTKSIEKFTGKGIVMMMTDDKH